MYILVEVGESTSTTFSDLEKLRDWVLEKCPLENVTLAETSAKEVLQKVAELVGPFIVKASIEEKKLEPAIEQKEEDDENTSTTISYIDTTLSKGIHISPFSIINKKSFKYIPYIKDDAERGEKAKSTLDELCKFYRDTFYAPKETRISLQVSAKFYNYMTKLFISHPKFCLENPLMIKTHVEMKEEYYKLIEEYNANEIYTKLFETYLPHTGINEDTCMLFFKLYTNIEKLSENFYVPNKKFPDYSNKEELIYNTITIYATNKLNSETLNMWITKFVNTELKENEEGQIQSSELYSLWVGYLGKVFDFEMTGDRGNFKDIIISLTNTRHFAKLLKSIGIDTVRKSSGIFYTGIEKKTEIQKTTSEYISGFDATESTFYSF